jgi:5-methylcytosine-specific restriction endonuclease McrA
MDYKTFKSRYFGASHRFIWEDDIIRDYVPVIDKAILDTINWFELAEIAVSDEEIGGAIFPRNEYHGKRLALYIKNRRTKNLGSIYSIFKENFNVITKGYDDRTGLPFPPLRLDACISLFESLGKSKSEAKNFWNNVQSYKRRITRFDTLANKSINRQRRVPPKLRLEVLARDGFRCILCGRTAEETTLHVDHITPVAKGGSNELDYLATLCQECNLGKGTQSIEDILHNNKR